MHDVFDARAMLGLGTVRAIDDTGAVQRADIVTTTGGTYAGVEVMQIFGLASRPPVDGATAAVLAIGGDPANLRALPMANVAWRFGKLAGGEVALYGSDGTRVHIRQGGVIEIHASGNVLIKSAGTVTIDAAKTYVTGDLTVHGTIADQDGVHGSFGDLRADYNAHRHGGSTTTDHPTA